MLVGCIETKMANEALNLVVSLTRPSTPAPSTGAGKLRTAGRVIICFSAVLVCIFC
jgi:hypothetical protein